MSQTKFFDYFPLYTALLVAIKQPNIVYLCSSIRFHNSHPYRHSRSFRMCWSNTRWCYTCLGSQHIRLHLNVQQITWQSWHGFNVRDSFQNTKHSFCTIRAKIIITIFNYRQRASTWLYSLTFLRSCSALLGGSLYHAPKSHPGPCSSEGVRPRTDTQTHRHTWRAWPQNILRRLRLTQNKCNNLTSIVSNLRYFYYA